jgi:hypothetical protein
VAQCGSWLWPILVCQKPGRKPLRVTDSRRLRGNRFNRRASNRGFTFRTTAYFPDIASRSRRGFAREFCLNFPSPDIRGRRECRALNAPAASCVKKQTHELVTTVTPEFPAQWFYGLLRALPGDHALLTPSPARLHADLTPALGRQNDTTWPYASRPLVSRAATVHRIPPRVRDVRTPLCGVGR